MTGDTFSCLDEDAVQAYVERRMSADQRALVEHHLDSCVDCRRLVSSMVQLYAGQAVDEQVTELGVTESLSGVPTDLPLQRGDTVSRYVILDFLGAGGMGVVHSAYDPELDRKIALKLLRASTLDAAHARMGRVRLLREAKTMARVSHPNVVSVYDAGTYGERVFIAMEFVEGTTLKRWLKDQPRSWREILDVFVQAGRGLAAAHAAGLVHRDFKPENVLIGPNGRVLVTDFGLARGGLSSDGSVEIPPEPAPPPTPEPERPRPAQPSANTTLTITGQVVGTPAYMSPEQHAGKPTSPKSDQFSFCVALYEGLYGERPYPGDSTEVLLSSMASGKVPDAPSSVPVPASLRRVLLRGLRTDPEERFPSMEALLDALTERPRVGRRRALAIGAAGLMAVAGIALSLRPGRGELCRGAERKLTGIWDAERKRAIQQLFLATGRPTAADTWVRIEQAIDAYARDWTAMHTEACEATRVRGEQSDEVLSLRMLCLDRRLSEVKALAQVLGTGTPDAQVVDNAIKSAQALTPLGGCADVAALKAQVPLPADPASRAKVEELRARLAEAKVLYDTGKYRRGIDAAKALVEEGRALRYSPLLADALQLLANFQDRLGDSKTAEQTFYEAVTAAEAGHEDRMVVRIWGSLMYLAGVRQGRHELALLLGKAANAAMARVGEDAELEGGIAGNIGNVLFDAGRYEEALPYVQKALALVEKVSGPRGLRTATTYNNAAAVYWGLGRVDDALAAFERALEIRRSVLGPRHADVAAVLNNLARVRLTQHRYADAEALYREALSIREEALPAEHPSIVMSLNSLATTLSERGKLAEGEALHRRALALAEKVLGPEHKELAGTLHDFAVSLSAQGRYAEACPLERRGLAIREKVLGAEDPAIAESLRGLAACSSGLGKQDVALSLLRRAASLHAKVAEKDRQEQVKTLVALGQVQQAKRQHRPALASYQEASKLLEPADVDVAPALAGLGSAYLALGEPRKAVEPLERALKLREGWQGDPREVVELRFTLARALWAAKQDRAHARELAIEAKDGYARLGERGRKGAEQVGKWLALARPEKK